MMSSENNFGRRKMLKALAGLPIVGALGIQVLRKTGYDDRHNMQRKIIKELGLEDLMSSVKQVSENAGGEVIRIGIAGFGTRGPQLASALGFMEKTQFNRAMAAEDGSFDALMNQGNFNVAITGICDVFDLHAENGMVTAQHDIHTGGEFAAKHPVKRYRHYHDMISDQNIDAVIIATPDSTLR